MKTKRHKAKRATDGAYIATARANRFLQPVIDGTAGYGDRKRLAEKITEKTGALISYNTLNRWLHKDAKKRQQPLLGSGLLVREVFDSEQKKQQTKRKDTK